MSSGDRSLKNCYIDAERLRRSLDTYNATTSDEYQTTLSTAIATYEECTRIAESVSLFSPNEGVEDITSSDLQYLLLSYHTAELVQRITTGGRRTNLERAQQQYERFLKLLDHYDILEKSDLRLFEQYQDNPRRFSTASVTDAAARREVKITRFKAEKELKRKIEYLQQNPSALSGDDEALRNLHLTHIKYAVHMTFQALESIAQELQILSIAPPDPPQDSQLPLDLRQRQADSNGYSERLDGPLSSIFSKTGPILDKSGRPMRPFTLLDTRQRLQDGVFRPDHSLPTMTIDEYLEEERRRGGIIEGGGAASGIRPEPNEDDLDKADEETMKARAWDEYKEANQKGSGNTMNMG